MTVEMLVLLLVVVLVIGVFYNSTWGYTPIGLLAILLIVLLAWTLYNGKTPQANTENLRQHLRETGSELKELGRDTADVVRDAVQPKP